MHIKGNAWELSHVISINGLWVDAGHLVPNSAIAAWYSTAFLVPLEIWSCSILFSLNKFYSIIYIVKLTDIQYTGWWIFTYDCNQHV